MIKGDRGKQLSPGRRFELKGGVTDAIGNCSLLGLRGFRYPPHSVGETLLQHSLIQSWLRSGCSARLSRAERNKAGIATVDAAHWSNQSLATVCPRTHRRAPLNAASLLRRMDSHGRSALFQQIAEMIAKVKQYDRHISLMLSCRIP